MKLRVVIPLLIITLSFIGVSSAPITEASVIIFPDGWAEVSISVSGIEANRYELRIQGEPHNLMVSSGGLLLNYTLRGNSLIIDTLGLGEVEVNYQTPSLTSKQGVIWNASLSLPSQLTRVLLPPEATILGMSSLPEEISFEGNWIRLSFQTGSLWISYKFETLVITRSQPSNELKQKASVSEPKESASFNATESAIGSEVTSGAHAQLISYAPYILASLLVILILGGAIKLRSKRKPQTMDEIEELILRELRERGGKTTQAELTKALGLPRATIWRRLRKLEREGIIALDRRGNITEVRLR